MRASWFLVWTICTIILQSACAWTRDAFTVAVEDEKTSLHFYRDQKSEDVTVRSKAYCATCATKAIKLDIIRHVKLTYSITVQSLIETVFGMEISRTWSKHIITLFRMLWKVISPVGSLFQLTRCVPHLLLPVVSIFSSLMKGFLWKSKIPARQVKIHQEIIGKLDR